MNAIKAAKNKNFNELPDNIKCKNNDHDELKRLVGWLTFISHLDNLLPDKSHWQFLAHYKIQNLYNFFNFRT